MYDMAEIIGTFWHKIYFFKYIYFFNIIYCRKNMTISIQINLLLPT